ncbi:S-layer homology domain-containing protein [Paenibacillus sp. yr247]|uniref:S-layer homology domain-containing protein n=1 Tax=Paenibacillus sp. yr247 TaxID=1761880 RepID=UPI00088E27C6|nr:S-layer homology domain-containing protein [Paenibacillus sp. yr247]SDO00909.1 S-layer homology domain-containing protein [Paenibacillus sp. yr247]
MVMKKFIVTTALISLLSVSAVPAFAAEKNQSSISVQTKISLDDVKGHWAREAIDALVEKGILQGEDDHHFNPDKLVTREAFAAMVARTFHLKNTSTIQDFNDVGPKRWSFNVIEATKDYFDRYKSLNEGYNFEPTLGAKREDVTVTLVKVLMKQNSSIQLLDAAAAEALLTSKFTDTNSIPEVLRPYVATAVQNNLIQGDDQHRFHPNATLTRAEAATLLYRLLKNNVVVDVPTGNNTNGSTVTGNTYGSN